MLSTPLLNQINIFAIPLIEPPDPLKEKEVMLYAPLAGSLFFLNKDEVARMEEYKKQRKETLPSSLRDILEPLEKASLAPPKNYVKTPFDVCALTILPNNICNFSCSYCYAAAGHSNNELSRHDLQSVLDFFIDNRRTTCKDLYISFGGGGEPFLSWDLVEYAMEYASQRALEMGKTLHFSFASNGSICNKHILEVLKAYHVKANVSFDILERIQNVQRKHYDKVCATLDSFLEADIIPSINSVITPLNVGLQEEMVEEIIRRFPKIRRLSFDSVVDGTLYSKSLELRDFYQSYTDNFFRARALGKEGSVDVNCIKMRNVDLIRERACPGGFDLTPQGTISSCFFVSSPREPLYQDFIYGKVEPSGKLYFDLEKFSKNLKDGVHQKEKCAKCFAKWHCGGGCHYQNQTYSGQMQEVMCDFVREFTKRTLLDKWLDMHV